MKIIKICIILRNHQNITEIRDVINKYGENAEIYLRWNSDDCR